MARLFIIFFVLVLAAVEAHDAVSPLETYWLSILRNTTMPNAIRNLIDPAMNDSGIVKHRVKVRGGITQNLFVLSGTLPSPDYVRSTFFPIKYMHPGAQMNQGLSFDQTIIGGAFVSRTKANRIKFCSDSLSQILGNFSMIPDSEEAKQIEKIVKDSEEPTLIGEKKYCSTFLDRVHDR